MSQIVLAGTDCDGKPIYADATSYWLGAFVPLKCGLPGCPFCAPGYQREEDPDEQ